MPRFWCRTLAIGHGLGLRIQRSRALDAIGGQDEPLHVARFGARFDAQGVLAGSKDANRCIGYLTKYLIKHLGDCHALRHRR